MYTASDGHDILGLFCGLGMELLGQPEILWDLGGVVDGIIYNEVHYLSFDVVAPILSPQLHCINSTASTRDTSTCSPLTDLTVPAQQ